MTWHDIEAKADSRNEQKVKGEKKQVERRRTVSVPAKIPIMAAPSKERQVVSCQLGSELGFEFLK